MEKDNRGGAREGAGRPRFETEEQKRRNISLSDGIRKAIEAFK